MHTSIPDYELQFFKDLKNIKVVFDVGARADTDYLDLKPRIQLHAFEPNIEFFQELQEKIGNRKNVFLNNIGLGDRVAENVGYNHFRQAFVDGEEPDLVGETTFPMTTLDLYAGERGIERIDFLKIDTEGYDYKVLQGGLNTIPKCRYIQYEHWNDTRHFHGLLETNFYMTYIGGRNVLCKNKHL